MLFIQESDSEEHDDEPNGVESYFQASDPVSAMNLTPKEPDRQLSKKELKKKELAELEAVLAELGLNQQDVQGDRIVCLFFNVGCYLAWLKEFFYCHWWLCCQTECEN